MPADQKVFGLFFRVCQGRLKNKNIYCRDVSIVVLAKNIIEATEKLNVKIIGDPAGSTKVKLPFDPPQWFRRGIVEEIRKKLWQTRFLELDTVWHVEQVPLFYE